MIIQSIMEAEAQLQTAEYDARSGPALDKLVNQHGVKLRRFSDALLMEFGKASADVVAKVGNSDATTRKVWDSYRKFRKLSIGWSKIGRQAYMNARALPFKYG